MSHPYALSDAAELFSPALVFYPETIKRNIARVVELAGGPGRLRPHAKTHKTREITKLQLAAGVTKHKCATVAEAEMLAQCNVPDVLIAYPIVGPNAKRVAALAKKYPETKFSVLIDHPAGAAEVSAAATAAGITLGFLLDLDVGQHRTGIALDQAADLYRTAAKLPGLKPNGLHAYDGHNTTEPPADREATALDNVGRVLELRHAIEAKGVPVPRIVAGGTPPFTAYAKMTDVAGLECSPGTYVLHDHGYGTKFPDLSGVTPAAVLLTRVVSRPTPDRVTFDLGTKAVASDPPAGKRVALLDFPEHTPVGHNEEHYIVETSEAGKYRPGDIAYALPAHICPTVALHREALIAEKGKIVGRWEIVARDRVLTV
jgi:D-serine deaminase-like pyridoxal phosphate-dependent protein